MNSLVNASLLDEAAVAKKTGECREPRQPNSTNKSQPYQSQNQGLRQRRDSDDAADGKPAELSEEDWQHRINKRRRAIADIKATEPYLRLRTSGPNRPTTPDPADRTMNKRRWDHVVGLWKEAFRASAPPTTTVQQAAALRRASAPGAPVRAAGTTTMQQPLGGHCSAARPRVEPAARWSRRAASCASDADDDDFLGRRHEEPPAKKKQQQKPLLGNLARTLLFVVVACAGLTCDQLLFGDVVATEPTTCERPPLAVEQVKGSIEFEELAGGASLELGLAQASTPLPDPLGVADPGANRVSFAVN